MPIRSPFALDAVAWLIALPAMCALGCATTPASRDSAHAAPEPSPAAAACPVTSACHGQIMSVLPAFERIEDPAVVAQVLNSRVLEGPGAGGLCAAEAWKYVGPTPVTVYRLQTPRPDGSMGWWWTFAPPEGSAEAYRERYVICPEWNDFREVVMCKLRPGAHLAIGVGQSATCGKEGDNLSCLRPSPANQVNIDPAQVTDCTRGPFSFERPTVEVTTYGESFIEAGIPAASELEPEGIVDGWSVRFDRFLVVLADLEMARADGETFRDPRARVFDLTRPGPHPGARYSDLKVGAYDRLAVSVRPAPDAVSGNVDAAELARMKEAGWSVFVSGRAARGEAVKTFAWGFDTNTRYSDCTDAEDQPGIVVPKSGRVTAQFTIHGDHLLYDDLQDPDSVMRFDAIAGADRNRDGEVTSGELAATKLATLPADRYGNGDDARLEDLAQFIGRLTQTLVHFQGEGHCRAEPR